MSNAYSPTKYPNGIAVTNSDDSGLATVNSIAISNNDTNSTAKMAKVDITSAQLLALRAAPITLIAAPGDGLLTIVNRCLFTFTYGTIAYTVTNVGPFALTMNGINIGSTVAANVFFTATVNKLFTMLTPDTIPVTTDTTLINKALTFTNGGAAELLTGDGILSITLWYEIYEV